MNKSIIIPLNCPKEKLVEQVGGKAYNLTKLTLANFNVPDGFVLTNGLKHNFFERNKIYDILKKEMQSLLSDDFVTCSNSAKNVREAIISGEFTNEELKLINDAISELTNNNPNTSLAVRSSGGIEDGKTDSWAGQFDSFLNVNIQDITYYIKRCWASMYGVRAIRYNSNALLKSKEKSSFSVIVQLMIKGDYSGIAFSVDPIDENSSHVRIEAVAGAGDKVVGGQETPYSVILGKEDGLVIRRHFGGQGRIELLQPSILKELMTQIVQIEKLLETPVDVEWTIRDSNISILQARPITSLHISQSKQMNDLPDILDYELTFKVAGLGFMFADLLSYGFGYLHPLFICNDGEFLQYFTKERMEYAARYGHRWLSTPNGFTDYQKEFTLFHEQNFPKLSNIVDSDLCSDNVQNFFSLVYDYFTFYSKMDFQFTNLTFLYANENPVIAENLKKISVFKDTARVWINEVSINDDCLLNRLLIKLSNTFNVSTDKLGSYKISEIFDIFDGKMVVEEELKLRALNSIVMSDGHTIKYIGSEQAAIFINHVKEIMTSQASANIIGQVANKGSERFVTGSVCLINVDYGNLEKMEQSIANMKNGQILVSEFTAPELMAACSKAKAIVTDMGGMLSHAAIVSRELGIPCIVGTEHASRSLSDGDQVKIDIELGIVEKILI